MDLDNIKWKEWTPRVEEDDTTKYKEDAIDKCIVLLNKNSHSPAAAIGIGDTFIKVERLLNPSGYRVMEGKIVRYGFVNATVERTGPNSKYSHEYLEYLRDYENTEIIADLIESIKKAQLIGMEGTHFSEVATKTIISRLHALVPSMRDIVPDEKMMKDITESPNGEPTT